MTRPVALVAVGAVLTWTEWATSSNATVAILILDIVVGWTFLAGAWLVDPVRGRSLVALFSATGVAWFLGAPVAPLQMAFIGPFGHLLGSFPTGRPVRAFSRAAIALAYAASVASVLMPADSWLALGAAGAGTAAIVTARRSTGEVRRGRLAAGFAALATAVGASAGSVAVTGGVIGLQAERALIDGCLAVSALGLATVQRLGSSPADTVARLVIDLGNDPETGTLRDRLAEALDEPSLIIAFASPDGEGHVDELGRPVELPDAAHGRTATPLTADGTEIGVLVTDAGGVSDPRLIQGVVEAARLALANARLHERNRREVAQLEASRARLVSAVDAQRARIRAELESGVLARLSRIAQLLAGDERMAEETRAVTDQLMALGDGLGPGTALGRGLARGVHALAERSPVPVTIDVPDTELPENVAVAAWFVCAEGLTNVARHSRASRAWVRTRIDDGALRLEIGDDGIGGANPGEGSGLSGLVDRLNAIGGSLVVEPVATGGTRVIATIPTTLLTEAIPS